MTTQKLRTDETVRFDVYAAEQSSAYTRTFRTDGKQHMFVFKNVIRFVSALLLLGFFASCATVQTRSMRYPVYVTNTRVVDLLAVEYMTSPVDALYMFTGSFGTASFYMQAFIQANESGIFINLLNDFGSDMGTLTYTGGELALASAVLPKSLKAQYIVADIQFAYYDAAAVAQSLRSAGLDFIVTNDGDIELRRIMNGKKCIEEISISSSSVSIINHLRGYEYHLTEAM